MTFFSEFESLCGKVTVFVVRWSILPYHTVSNYIKKVCGVCGNVVGCSRVVVLNNIKDILFLLYNYLTTPYHFTTTIIIINKISSNNVVR
jgi:hypothetical protein